MTKSARGRTGAYVALVAGVLISVLLGIGLSLAGSAPSASDGEIVWVGGSGGLLAIDTAEGQVQQSVPSQQSVHAVAVDPVHRRIWVQAGLNRLRAYDFDGTLVVDATLPVSLLDLISPRALAVDGHAGNVWLAVGNTLYRFDNSGVLQSNFSPSLRLFRGLSVDTVRARLWTVDRTTLYALDASGNEIFRVTPTGLGLGGAQDIAFDAGLDRLWLASNHAIHRYDEVGTRDFSTSFSGIVNVIAPDHHGGLWVGASATLYQVDHSGLVNFSLQPFAGLPLFESTVDLVAAPTDGSAWVASHRRVRHYALDGALLHTVEPDAWFNINGLSRMPSGTVEVTILDPEDGALINNTMPDVLVQVDGIDIQPEALTLELDEAELPALCTALAGIFECALTHALSEGERSIVAVVESNAGARFASAPVIVIVDVTPPVISIISPADGGHTNEPELTVTGHLSESADVVVNGVPVTLAEDLEFSLVVSLEEGANTLLIIATDPAGNESQAQLTVILDTVPPPVPDAELITAQSDGDGETTVSGQAGSVEGGAEVDITNIATGVTVTVVAEADGSFLALISAEAGQQLAITVRDTAGNQSGSAHVNVSAVPSEPQAPPVSETATTPFLDRMSFLFEGSEAVQHGLQEGAVTALGAAVIRGQVLQRNGDPLAGVRVSVRNRPQFGHTFSRSNGVFDLVVEGGQELIIEYSLNGYLPLQRKLTAPWRDIVVAEDVVMIEPDPVATVVDFGTSAPAQVAQSSTVTDANGARQVSVLVPEGTGASLTLPGGDVIAMESLTLRATEYTVGAGGPAAMPGALPAATGYTYAVELGADEAVAVGATSIEFDQPVAFYVDNFLDFPVGIGVPTGYYDRERGAWIPSPDGRVIQILSISGGLAELDVDGSGDAADAAAYASLGITTTERQQLAQLYSSGKSLWRVSVTHFTPWDCNWPAGPPPGAVAPNIPKPSGGAGGGSDGAGAVGGSGETPNPDGKSDDQDTQCGSVIECQSRVLRQSIPVAGTGLSLNYRSDRVLGRNAAYTLEIPLSGAEVPSDVKRIDLEVSVAGRQIRQSFPAVANQSMTFVWDGEDAYGRTLFGEQRTLVRIGYVYPAYYYTPQQIADGSFAGSFGRFGDTPISGDRQRDEIVLWQQSEHRLGIHDARTQGFGGWTLTEHHAYDPFAGKLHRGDGGIESAQQNYGVLTLSAGGGSQSPGPGVLATDADIGSPQALVADAHGGYYMSRPGRIYYVSPQGTIERYAGGGQGGDGAFRLDVGLSPHLYGLALGPDGSLYYSEGQRFSPGWDQIHRIRPDGIVELVAGTGERGFEGDNGPAVEAKLNTPTALAVGQDGTLYFADSGNHRVRAVAPGGVIYTLAGTGEQGAAGDGGPAINAEFRYPSALAVGPDGSIYVDGGVTIRKITPDGIITRIAGTGSPSALSSEDGRVGLPATESRLPDVRSISVSDNGIVYFGTGYYWQPRVRYIDRKGNLGWLANSGTGSSSVSGLNGPATAARFDEQFRVAVMPDGQVLIGGYFTKRVYKVKPPLDRDGVDIHSVASRDGSDLYEFDGAGRHLRTVDARTGALRRQFNYIDGRLVEIVDGDGNTVTIQRDAAGRPIAITSPDGQRTEFALDTNGYLQSVTNPSNESWQLTHDGGGLLQGFTTPRAFTSTYAYLPTGHLHSSQDAEGGGWTLSRVEEAQGFTNTMTSAGGRAWQYRYERLPTGSERMTTIAPDGSEQQRLASHRGSILVTEANGTVTETIRSGDPRFGMQAPVPETTTITLPSGLVSVTEAAREVDLQSLVDPLSFTTITETRTRNENTWTSVFDASGRTYTYTSPEQRTAIVEVDAQHRPLQMAQTSLAPVVYAYDGRGRMTTLTQGEGGEERITALSYGTAGYVDAITDAENRTMSFEHDAVGRVKKQTLPDGREIHYDYDAAGNLTSLTPPGRTAHVFEYDGLEQPTDYVPPELSGISTLTRYLYNLDRQLTEVERPGGANVVFNYDAGGRLSGRATGADTLSYAYHPNTGQPASVASASGIQLGYGWDGFLPTETTWSGTVSGAVAWSWDTNLWLQQETVNGDSVSFGYDSDGLLTQAGALTLLRHPDHGLVTGTSVGEVQDSRDYSNFGELSEREVTADGTALYSVSYERDKLGRITEKTEAIAGQTHIWGYHYDTAGRLTSVTRNGALEYSYGYDTNSNRTSSTGPSGTRSGSYDAQDRIQSWGSATYTHTPAGEWQNKTTPEGTTTYAYDAAGNLRGIDFADGTEIEYLIDGQDRRVGKKVDGTLTRGWLYRDQLNPVAELDGSGNVTSRFVYAENPHVPSYMVKNGQSYRIVSDHLGSVRVVINTDTGQIAQRMDYSPFGEVVLDTNPGFQPFGFAGGLYDPDTKLVRFGARDYDPESGRWTAKDPILFDGGDANLYGYVLADPVNLVDPDGQNPLAIIGGLVGGALNAANNYGAWQAGQISTAQYAGSIAVGVATGAFSGLGVGVIRNALMGSMSAAGNRYFDNRVTGRSCNNLEGVGRAAALGGLAGFSTGLGQWFGRGRPVHSPYLDVRGTHEGLGGVIGFGVGTGTTVVLEP